MGLVTCVLAQWSALMPLLPAETLVFPPDLLCDLTPPIDTCARWWVLHTRSRAEKTLARQLLRRSLAWFLPLYQRRWRWKDRVQSSFVPLFPSYLFLWGDYDARLVALETNLVVRARKEPPDKGGWILLHTWWLASDIIDPAVHFGVSGAGSQNAEKICAAH